jgi:hypothetical protein
MIDLSHLTRSITHSERARRRPVGRRHLGRRTGSKHCRTASDRRCGIFDLWAMDLISLRSPKSLSAEDNRRLADPIWSWMGIHPNNSYMTSEADLACTTRLR